MSISSKITDEEMRFFQFRARQLYLLRKEDHEWNEFCKRNSCTCCSCETNKVPKVNKEVGVQSSPRRNLPTASRSIGTTLHPYNKNLPQTLNEIKTRLEKIDLTLSELKVPTKNEIKEVIKPNEIFNQQFNTLTLPMEDDMAESVKSVINERRMQLIQESLKMSLQRLQSAALRSTRPNLNVKKKSSGYFIPRELERQRAAARRAYLASLERTTAIEPKVLPQSTKGKTGTKREILKAKSLKAATKSNLRKLKKSCKQKEDEPTLVASVQIPETKDENIETAVDAIMDDILGETVLVINKIKQSKSSKSSTEIPNIVHVSNPVSSKDISMDLHSKESELAMFGHFQNKLEKVRRNLQCARTKTDTNSREKLETVEIKSTAKGTISNKSEPVISPEVSSSIHLKRFAEIENVQPLRELSIDAVKARHIAESRKAYWNYLEKISRSKKGSFDPWALSSLVAESLLDDCMEEIANELQDVPSSLIADLYDQEFLQSI